MWKVLYNTNVIPQTLCFIVRLCKSILVGCIRYTFFRSSVFLVWRDCLICPNVYAFFVILLSQEQIPDNFSRGISFSNTFPRDSITFFCVQTEHEKIVKGCNFVFPQSFQHFTATYKTTKTTKYIEMLSPIHNVHVQD